jgi:hypothetical protein
LRRKREGSPASATRARLLRGEPELLDFNFR